MKRRHVVPAALGLGAVVLAAGVGIAHVAAVPIGVLTRDAVTTADLPPYTGAIAALTTMVWFAAGCLSAFVAWIDADERRRMVPFACLLFALAADDSLLLHDAVGPHLGISELAFYAVYGIGAVTVAAGMLGGERILVVAFWSGAALLAGSAFVDVAFVGRYLLEDGAKLLGALIWATVPLLAHSNPARAGRSDGRPTDAGHRVDPRPVAP